MNRQNGLSSKFRPGRLALGAAYQIRRFTSGMTLGVRTMLIKNDRIVLVRHTYSPGWHMPGGGVERGESIHEAAIREAQEEAGVDMTEPAQLFGFYRNGRRDHVALFVCHDWQQISPPRLPSLEISACELFALSDLPEDVSVGTLRRLKEYQDGLAPSRDW